VRPVLSALIVLLLTSCGSTPPGECEVTAEGNEYRSRVPSEQDQLPGAPEIGQRYRAASGCVPGDNLVGE